MSNDLDLFANAGDGLIRRGETVFVDFDGGRVAVVLVDGEPQPILNLACRDLALDWKSQHKKISADPAICMVETTTQLPGDDQSRVVMTTDLDGFVLWLAKINANKVGSGARDLVINWQRKAARAIRERFFGKASTEPAARPSLAVVPDLSGLSAEGLEWLGQVGKALTATTAELASAKRELESARTKVEYVDQFVQADEGACLLRVFANQIKVGEQALRDYLLDRGVIYNTPFRRWSKKKQGLVTENWYHAYAQYKAWFTERDQPKAPRTPDGRMTTTLDITPVGKTGVKRMLQRHPLVIEGGEAS